jgi:hypothetical protein
LTDAQLLLEGETLEPADTLYGGFPPRFPRPARQPGRQAVPQLRKRLPHSFLHRLDGDLERTGDLDISEPMLAAQLKDFATLVGQASYGIAHRALQLETEDLFLGRWRARGIHSRGCSFAFDDSLMPNVVEGPIARRPNEIGAKGLLYLQRLATPPQLEHHFLRNLLGQCALSNDRLRHSHEVWVVRAKHRIERTLVSSPDSLLQIPLIRVIDIQVG